MNKTQRLLIGTILTIVAGCNLTHAQPTAFKYTGYLLEGGSPAYGSVTVTNQPVTDGILVVALNIGGVAFDGKSHWLEIAA
jgi:hypothetical protein